MSRNFAIVVGALAAYVAAVPEARALPDIEWSSYYGGSSADQAFDVHFDSYGDLIVVGRTGSNSGIADGGEDDSHNGDYDGYVAKFDFHGTRLWGTYLGGSGGDDLFAVVTDSSDNIITAGNARSSGLSTLGTTHDGGADVIVAKYDPSGNLLWSTYIGGEANDYTRGICVAGNGTVYVVGRTVSSTGLATGTVHDTSLNGSEDGFIAKVTSAGAISWVTYYGGSTGWTWVDDCVVGPLADVYVVGTTTATTGIAFNASHDGGHNGDRDAFIAKFTSAGVLTWSNYYGGAGTDHGNGIDIDSGGAIYIAGSTESANGLYQAIATTVDTSLGGTGDGFAARFTSGGTRTWGRYFGGPGDDGFDDLEISSLDVLHLVGSTNSTSGIITVDAFDSTQAGSDDAMYVTIDGDTAVQGHGSYLGGSSIDQGYGVAVQYSEAAICGDTPSTSGIASPGAHDTTWNGGLDAFVTWIHLFAV